MSEPSPKDPSIDEQIENKKQEMHAENLAFLASLQDSDFMKTAIDRASAEAEIEQTGRIQASGRSRVARGRVAQATTYPWGIEYLEEEKDPLSIFEKVLREEKDKRQGEDIAVTERNQTLEAEMIKARALTLELGATVAKKMKGAVPTNVVVKTQHVDHVKKFSGEGLRMEGNLRSQIPQVTLRGKIEGWLLPIAGQVHDKGTTVLCADGRILTAFGDLQANENGKAQLVVKPNVEGSKGSAPQTYSRFMDTDFGSDLGMANLPINPGIVKARVVLAREQAMQEAVVSMLVQHDIPITSEPGTTKPTAKREKLGEPDPISDDEKKYRDEGGEYIDPRFDDEVTEAFRGETHLLGIPGAIEVKNYVMSHVTDGELKHYFEYADAANRPSFTTLDQFLWSQMSPERREELKRAGLDPDDLETGKHPILKPYW